MIGQVIKIEIFNLKAPSIHTKHQLISTFWGNIYKDIHSCLIYQKLFTYFQMPKSHNRGEEPGVEQNDVQKHKFYRPKVLGEFNLKIKL